MQRTSQPAQLNTQVLACAAPVQHQIIHAGRANLSLGISHTQQHVETADEPAGSGTCPLSCSTCYGMRCSATATASTGTVAADTDHMAASASWRGWPQQLAAAAACTTSTASRSTDQGQQVLAAVSRLQDSSRPCQGAEQKGDRRWRAVSGEPMSLHQWEQPCSVPMHATPVFQLSQREGR